MSLRRRSFIAAGLGAGAVVTGGLLLPPGRPLIQQWFGARPLPEHLRMGQSAYLVLDGLQGTDALAVAFLEQHDHDDTDLENWLIEHLELSPEDPPDAVEFSRRLRAAIIDDFEHDRLCDANDWLLSETECRAAALRYRVFGPTPTRRDAGFRNGVIVRVTDWGPRSTEAGRPVNVQADGHSGLWFQATGAPPWLKLEIDGDLVPVSVAEDLFTSGLFDKLQERILAAPGEYPIVLIDEMARIRQPVGHFVVTERPERVQLPDGRHAHALCAVEDWGPRETIVGIATNPQPNDASGLWFRTACAPTAARILFDGAALATTVDMDQGLITALLPNAYLGAARTAMIVLHDPETDETLEVGQFRIMDRNS